MPDRTLARRPDRGLAARISARHARPAALALIAAAAALPVMLTMPAEGQPAAQAGARPVATAAPAADNGMDSAWDRAAERFGGSKAETRPRLDTTMQFSFATEVREISARGGQRVKEGELLMTARDAEILAALDQQRLVAASDAEVRAAQQRVELAEFRFTQLKASQTYSPTEFEELRIGAETAKVELEQARTNFERQRLSLKQLEGQAERYYLRAPFAGIVEEVLVEIGQGVNEQQKALRLVNTDRLILDAYPGTDETLRLRLDKGGKAWVLLDVEPAGGAAGAGGTEATWPVVEGVIDYVSPVADSVSQTRRVRVEIANAAGWPAGTQARVRFTPPEQTTAAGGTTR